MWRRRCPPRRPSGCSDRLGAAGETVVILCDIQGAVALMRNPKSSNQTMHIDVTHHVVRECVDVGGTLVEAFGTKVMVAEYLTI